MGPEVAVGGVVLVHDAGEKGAGSAFIPGTSPHVLLIKRGRPPRMGSWTLPGGRVLRGERLEEAVRREIREETGIEVVVGELVEVFEIVEDDYHYVILDYVARASAGLEGLRAGDDAVDAVLVPISELDDYAVSEAVRRVVHRALAMTSDEA